MYVLLWRTVYALTRVLFWCYFPRCCATREINTKITLSWVHKQFATRVTSGDRQGDPKSSLRFFARDVISLCRSVAVSTTSRSRPLAAHFKISFVPIRYVFLLFKQVLIFALQLKIRFWVDYIGAGSVLHELPFVNLCEYQLRCSCISMNGCPSYIILRHEYVWRLKYPMRYIWKK